MRRVISSGWIIIFKLIIPLAFTALSIFLVLSLFAYEQRPPRNAIIGVLMVVGVNVYNWWWGVKLKQVSVDDRNLYAANLTREITIPLSEIDYVYDFPGGWPVIVRLKAESEFGRSIFFIAKRKPFLYSSHPIVQELRELISRSRQ
jgi:hypothetical protein